MKIDETAILHVAQLAKLELSEDEKIEFSAQLPDIISYVKKISELDTGDIRPTEHIVELKNVFRDDIVRKSIDVSELQKMAPKFEDGHIVVPIIIGGQE